MNKKIVFNSEYLKKLIETDKRNKGGKDKRSKDGSINRFATLLTESGHSITREGVHLWLLGRMPKVEALVSVSDYFGTSMESLIIKK